MQHVALLSPRVWLRRLMSQRQFGGQVRIALDQGRGKHFAECLLKGLAINPESLIVIALPQRKGDQRHLPAACNRGVRGGVIKWCLLVAYIVLGAALEQWFAQHGQDLRRRFGTPLRGTLVEGIWIRRDIT